MRQALKAAISRRRGSWNTEPPPAAEEGVLTVIEGNLDIIRWELLSDHQRKGDKIDDDDALALIIAAFSSVDEDSKVDSLKKINDEFKNLYKSISNLQCFFEKISGLKANDILLESKALVQVDAAYLYWLNRIKIDLSFVEFVKKNMSNDAIKGRSRATKFVYYLTSCFVARAKQPYNEFCLGLAQVLYPHDPIADIRSIQRYRQSPKL